MRRSPSNTCFLDLTQADNPYGILIGSAVFAQFTAERPYTLQRAALSPLKSTPSHYGIWTPSNTWFIGPIRAHNPNGISIGSAVFAQLTTEFPYTSQWAAPMPSKLPLPMGIWTPSDRRFLEPTWAHNPNGISIGSARQTTPLGL